MMPCRADTELGSGTKISEANELSIASRSEAGCSTANGSWDSQSPQVRRKQPALVFTVVFHGLTD